MYEHLSRGDPYHIKKRYVKTALDSFTILRSDGQHRCLVHVPLWGSLRDLIVRNPYRDRVTEEFLQVTLQRLIHALDYLHTDPKVIHTGTI